MYIDREKALQLEIAPMTLEVERGRLRFFAHTIGLTDPIYFDVDAARRAGHRDLVVPRPFLATPSSSNSPTPWAGSLRWAPT